MQHVNLFQSNDIRSLLKKRGGESKIGEMVQVFQPECLNDPNLRFVLLGIPEDIGVRANFGRAGAHTAFRPALESFLSQQSNFYFSGREVLVLGELIVDDLMERASHLDMKLKPDQQKMRDLVAEIDARLFPVIEQIVAAGKIPIVIGGGHNNCFGNIKGSSIASGSKVNVINCDPHLDFRPLDGRHSGNGFSYAFDSGLIHRYADVCMHEQYNNSFSLESFRKHAGNLFYNTYESVFIREEKEFSRAVEECIAFVKDQPCGVEIDLDAITNVPSSARTSSGISPIQARQFVHRCAAELNPLYLHIAEGAPVLAHLKADNKTGKLIAYLITDFMKAVLSKSNSN